HGVAKAGLQLSVGVDVDPYRERTAPIPLLVGDIPSCRKKDAAVVGENVDCFQGAAGNPFPWRDAKCCFRESLFKYKHTFFRLVVRTGRKVEFSSTEICL